MVPLAKNGSYDPFFFLCLYLTGRAGGGFRGGLARVAGPAGCGCGGRIVLWLAYRSADDVLRRNAAGYLGRRMIRRWGGADRGRAAGAGSWGGAEVPASDRLRRGWSVFRPLCGPAIACAGREVAGGHRNPAVRHSGLKNGLEAAGRGEAGRSGGAGVSSRRLEALRSFVSADPGCAAGCSRSLCGLSAGYAGGGADRYTPDALNGAYRNPCFDTLPSIFGGLPRLMEDGAHDDVGRALVARGVVFGDAARLLEELLVVAQRGEPSAQLVVVLHRAGGAERHQVARLLELMVVGAEGDGQAERRGLQRVVDAHAETAADVAPRGIAVDRREEPHGVEHEQLLRAVGRTGRALGVAHRAAVRALDEPGYALRVHLVGRHDELHVGVVVHQAHEQLFVGPPRRPGDEEARVAAEALHDVDLPGRARDLGHAVEARVARDDRVVEAQLGEQPFRLLVLHEEDVEGLQRLAPHAAVAAEEDRVAAEDGRDDVGAHLAAAQLGEQVEPELVLDKDRHLGTCDVEEAAGVARRVEGQVEDVVGTLVLLADLIARG